MDTLPDAIPPRPPGRAALLDLAAWVRDRPGNGERGKEIAEIDRLQALQVSR